MRIGSRFKSPVANIVVGCESIPWMSEIRFLGVSLLSSSTFKCNFQTVRQKYFRALNGIFGKIGTRSSPLVTLSLISAYCVPILTYGIESLNVPRAVFNVLDNAYIAGFAKIFGTYDKDIIKHCQFYCGATPLRDIIDLRRLNFLNGIRKNGSTAIRLLFEVDGKTEFSSIVGKHSLSEKPVGNSWKNTLWSNFANSLIVTAE